MEVKEIEGTSLSYRTGDSGGNCWFSIENIPAEIKEKLPHDIKIQYDGFTSEVNDNYSDPTMRRALTEKKAEDQNRFFSDFVEEIRKYKTVEFVTPTRYEV